MKKIKILIVGSKGYIGSRLYQILEKKFDIFGIDNFLYGKTNIEKNYQKNFMNIDLRDIKNSFLENFTHVVFLAGLSNNPIDDLFPKKAYEVVEDYTIKFAKKCKKKKIIFIFSSSCSVYGLAKKRNLNENSKTNPITFYSKNKLNIEKKLLKISNKKFKPIILRFGTIFGSSPSIRFDLVLNMFCVMLHKTNKLELNSDGQANRPHLFIDDACKAIELSIFYKNKKSLILNVGFNNFNKKIIQTAFLFRSIKKKTSMVFTYKDNKKTLFKDSLVNKIDKRNYIVNFDKIKKIYPKFKQNISLKDIIISFFKKIKKYEYRINNINYYRLQKIKYLIKNKKINKKNLRCF